VTAIDRRSLISGPNHWVSIDAHGLNPLAEDYRGVNPDTYGVSVSKAGPPPKMFSGGTADLPAFLASGLDPQLLLQLPATARHAAAAEPDVAKVHAIFEQAGSDPYLTIGHEGLDAAIGRVRAWASGRMDKTTEAGA
jgi:hypothetical protein